MDVQYQKFLDELESMVENRIFTKKVEIFKEEGLDLIEDLESSYQDFFRKHVKLVTDEVGVNLFQCAQNEIQNCMKALTDRAKKYSSMDQEEFAKLEQR